MGEGHDTGRWISEPLETIIPTSGMDFTFSIPFSSVFLEGPIISMNDVMHPQSPSPPTRSSPPQNVSCYMPMINNVVPDPLVASFSSVSLSSEDGRIHYALRNRLVLLDSPLGVGKILAKGRGRGGGLASSSRGRRSHMDLGKEKAFFDCAAGTQLTIQRVLRASYPRSECP